MTASIATGVWFFPEAPAPALVDAIVDAERLGLDEVWLGDEGPAREPFTVLAAAAVATSTIRLAVGITNPYVRTPALSVTTALTIHELSGGRAILGVGAGGRMSLEPFGLHAARPAEAVRDYVATARAVAAGEPGAGYAPPAIAVEGAPGGRSMPVFVGARRQRLNRLASDVADGVFVAGLPPFRYDEVIGWARSRRPIDVALYPSVAFDEAAADHHRPHQIWSLADAPAEVAVDLGLDPNEVAAAASALAGGDEAAARRIVSDDLLPQLMLVGDPDTVGARLAELVDRHQPTSIGLALLQADLQRGLVDAAAAFHAMRAALEAR